MKTPRMLSPAQEARLFWAIVVQPLVVGGLALISGSMVLFHRSGRALAGGFAWDAADAALSVAVAASLVGLVVALVAALPLAVWLLKRRDVSLAEACVYGLGLGHAPLAVGIALAGTYGLEGLLRGAAFSSVLGLAGAAAFWAIAVRRPQRGHASQAS